MKNRKYAGQQAKRAAGNETGQGKWNGGEWRFVPSCKHFAKSDGGNHHCAGCSSSSHSHIICNSSCSWCCLECAWRPYRAACCTMRKIGAEINELAPSCEQLSGCSPGLGHSSTAPGSAATGFLSPPPSSCHSCLHGKHSPYTTYTIKHTHHMHTVIWNTHTYKVSIHNWAAEYAKEFCERAIKIVFFN